MTATELKYNWIPIFEKTGYVSMHGKGATYQYELLLEFELNSVFSGGGETCPRTPPAGQAPLALAVSPTQIRNPPFKFLDPPLATAALAAMVAGM